MNNNTRNPTVRGSTALIVALAMTLSMVPLPSAAAAPITLDLNTFQQKGDPSHGNWDVDVAGTSVTQTLQDEPSYFVTPAKYRDARLRGSVTTPALDDDFFGWSVHHKNPSSTGDVHRTIIVDWKGADQVHLGYSAPAGFTIYEIDGTVPQTGNNIWACFWGKDVADCPAPITVLATAHAPALGWEPSTTYDWSVRIEENLVRLWIDGGTGPFIGGAVAIETAAVSLGVEKFGLFTYEQAGVEFHDLWLDDFIAPSITQDISCVTPGANGWCLGNATMSSTAVDHASGMDTLTCRTQSLDVDCTGFTATEERSTAYSYKTTAEDLAGNTAVTFGSYKIDTELPEIAATVTCDGGADPLACDTFLTFAASATDSASGIDTLTCLVNAAPVACAGHVEVAEGSYTFAVTATDKAGRSNTTSPGGILDFTAPDVFATGECWPWHMNSWCPVYATSQGIGMDSGSGIASVECFLNGSPVSCASTNHNADGYHTFTVIATDKTGRTNTTSVDWKTDHTKPTGELTSPTPALVCGDLIFFDVDCIYTATSLTGPVVVDVLADDAMSGVHSVELWVDGWLHETIAAPGPYTFSWDHSSEALGEHELQVRIHDVAWNYRLFDVLVHVGP